MSELTRDVPRERLESRPYLRGAEVVDDEADTAYRTRNLARAVWRVMLSTHAIEDVHPVRPGIMRLRTR